MEAHSHWATRFCQRAACRTTPFTPSAANLTTSIRPPISCCSLSTNTNTNRPPTLWETRSCSAATGLCPYRDNLLLIEKLPKVMDFGVRLTRCSSRTCQSLRYGTRCDDRGWPSLVGLAARARSTPTVPTRSIPPCTSRPLPCKRAAPHPRPWRWGVDRRCPSRWRRSPTG
jgi:hypothetical protein